MESEKKPNKKRQKGGLAEMFNQLKIASNSKKSGIEIKIDPTEEKEYEENKLQSILKPKTP